MSLDPSQFTLDPVHDPHDDFGTTMSDQLRRAPWMMVSITAHILGGLLLFVLLESPAPLRQQVVTQIDVPDDEPEIDEEEPIIPEEIMPEVTDDVPVEDTVTSEDVHDTNVENVIDDNVVDSVTSEFDHNLANTAVGIGSGAAGKWGQRGGGREGLGNHATANTIRHGLEWLRRHQDEDGRWDADGFMKHDVQGDPCDDAGNPVHDIGVTGLALLAYLGDGSTMRSGPYREQVKKAVKFLRGQQGENGLFGIASSQHFIYDHAIATYAMCEAYGLSQYETLKRYAQGGINYLESHRNDYGCWRYRPRDQENDISVTGWCIMAYKSAKDFGLQVDGNALKHCALYLDELTDPTTGRCGYMKRGEASARHRGDHATRFPPHRCESLTAVGLFCRFFLGQDPKKTPVMKAAADTIAAKPPVWRKDGSIDHYYWYYGSYALYQMGATHWDSWRKHLTPAVVKTQRKDGNFQGSWDASGVWGGEGGRVYSTAMLVLTLEAYYRYTRIVR